MLMATEYVMTLRHLVVWMLQLVTTTLLQLKTMVLVLLMTSVVFVEELVSLQATVIVTVLNSTL
jgi:Na+-translocating ferredoxin:NAD+ oxidoreductase RnfA subunit